MHGRTVHLKAKNDVSPYPLHLRAEKRDRVRPCLQRPCRWALHVYIYYMFLLWGAIMLSFPGSRILPHPFWGSTSRAERACSGVGQCQGWFVHHGTFIEAWMKPKRDIQVKKTIEKTWRWFGVQGVGGVGNVYENVCFWDGVKLGGNLKCGRIEIFFVLAMIGWAKSDLRMPMNGASHHHLIDSHLC